MRDKKKGGIRFRISVLSRVTKRPGCGSEPHGSASFLEAGTGSALESKKLDLDPLQGKNSESFEAQNRTVEGRVWSWRLKMTPWRVSRPVVAEFHHFDEEQDPDPH